MRLGVTDDPICINASRWDCTLEPTDDEGLFAVRLGMRMVKGLPNAHATTIVAARAERPFLSIDDLWRRAGAPSASLVQPAEADAFRPALVSSGEKRFGRSRRFATNPSLSSQRPLLARTSLRLRLKNP
jgi:DNA polymerase III alpha subunit